MDLYVLPCHISIYNHQSPSIDLFCPVSTKHIRTSWRRRGNPLRDNLGKLVSLRFSICHLISPLILCERDTGIVTKMKVWQQSDSDNNGILYRIPGKILLQLLVICGKTEGMFFHHRMWEKIHIIFYFPRNTGESQKYPLLLLGYQGYPK